jgi:hypothetical protein
MDSMTAAQREFLTMDFTLNSGRVVTVHFGERVFPFALSELPGDLSLFIPVKEFLPELDYFVVETELWQWIAVSDDGDFFPRGSDERRALEENVYKWGTQTLRFSERKLQGMPEAVQMSEDYYTDVIILLRCLYREGAN